MFSKNCIVASLLFIYIPVFPCTTFFIHHNGKMVFGRNYDWLADAGMVCTNQQGLYKTSVPTSDGETISWQSKYGSISFNQYGKEFPTGGMNENGLVVELMWLDGTQYPTADDRPAIGVLQWIQYQLDICSTVEEVIATDKVLRITSGGTPLHYLVADAKGQTAAIEFLSGKMVVHKGANMPLAVLTNDTYERSIANHKKESASGDNSLERFSTACNMIQEFKASSNQGSLIDQSFSILDKVAQGDFTKWSIVYDISAKEIYFKTQQYPQIKTIGFSSFDFSCTKIPKLLDMNKPGQGDMTTHFQNFSSELNQFIFEKTIKQGSPRISIHPDQKKTVINYPNTISCK